jgi:large subunit ribosomal protein L21
MSEKQAKFAVIMTGGKQYQVSEGDVLNVERLGMTEGENIKFDKVMLVDDGSTTQIGTPFLEGAVVEASVISEVKARKVVGATYKAKSNRRKKYGHRQSLTKIKIEKIA